MATRRVKGEGSIYQDKNGRWVGRIDLGLKSNGSRFSKTFYGKTKKEVKEKLNNYTKNYRYSENNSNILLEDYILNWLNNYKKVELKSKSYDTLENTINNQIIPYIGNIPFKELNSNSLQNLITTLKEKGYSYSTVKKTYNALNNCLKHAVLNRELDYNLMGTVKLPRKDSFTFKNIAILPQESIDLFYDIANEITIDGNLKYKYGPYLNFILYTGIREGEAIALKWKNVDLENNIIHIKESAGSIKNRCNDSNLKYRQEIGTPKSFAGIRDIPLCKKAVHTLKIIKEHIHNGITNPSSLVMIRDKDDYNYVIAQTLLRNLRRILRDICIEDKIISMITIHSLRHTFATMLLESGADIKVVSNLLGHSGIEVTYNTYIHVIQSVKKRAVSSLDVYLN